MVRALCFALLCCIQELNELTVLVVQEPWKSLIASGEKTLEIRGASVTPRTVALAASGTQLITHLLDITGSQPVTRDELKLIRGHCIPLERIDTTVKYVHPHTWSLANVRPLRAPVKYVHPRGAINFIRLTPAIAAAVFDAASVDPFEELSAYYL